MFVVMCKVSGGVTGTRISQMKRNGELVWFDTKDEAEYAAQQARETIARNRFQTAHFQYWVEEWS